VHSEHPKCPKATDIIIHINTFYTRDAEGEKLEILDSIEAELGYPNDAIQIFEDPTNPDDGFDVYLKYLQVTSVPFELFESLGKDYKIYFLIIDLKTNIRHGYWFDEDDLWVTKAMEDDYIRRLDEIFKSNDTNLH